MLDQQFGFAEEGYSSFQITNLYLLNEDILHDRLPICICYEKIFFTLDWKFVFVE